jgi:hypothetical protein
MTFFTPLCSSFAKFIYQKMKGDTSISGKKTVEESAAKLNIMWVGRVFQDGLIKDVFWYYTKTHL